jgi:hypothetical protein
MSGEKCKDWMLRLFAKKRKTTGSVVFHWKLNFPDGFSRKMDRFHKITGSDLDIGRLQMVCISNLNENLIKYTFVDNRWRLKNKK